MKNVGGVQGATLTEIPEGGGEPQETKEPEPVVAPVNKKVVRLTIAVEFGGFHEEAETMEVAKARAEEIVAKGAWQKLGSGMVLHAPGAIRRVALVR
jgi:hypothetical protein